ncbi:MAG TPA: bifunctional diaminohydroxyphosphoribosylaminopyrimidine deaminase/5-amino-6-(5-phosphoribosylamino)uracil reductase RibD [Puia sp.]|nr:bifunctional diaminohydroxyphosphoribosylaminopyrimidine deaminase/5-amino-6-(5-phosphoribosylamino)uracil reductase RibD [Puia sp.]
MLSGSIPASERSAAALHEERMQRCLQLASLGMGYTAPNPLVGALLVHEGRIIGEGYHEQFGGPHAEVNCIRSVKETDLALISSSTLYVSLEPCAHHGKTPPCADLIIQQRIPRVVVACRDPFPEVDGRGMEKLEKNNVELIFPVLEEKAVGLNKRFFIFHRRRRPYIVLKWAESINHKIAGEPGQRIQISNEYSNRLVHKWRTEEAGILVGSQTALLDDPMLSARLWPGKNPVRIVLDRSLRLPETLKIFDRSAPTVILNEEKEGRSGDLIYKKIDSGKALIPEILSALYSLNILSILVEGGATLLQSFIDSGLWDEARVITNRQMEIAEGLSAPGLLNVIPVRSEQYFSDRIAYLKNGRAGLV